MIRAAVPGATRGSPRSARETVDWLTLSLLAMSLLVTATRRSMAYAAAASAAATRTAHERRRHLTRPRAEVYAYGVTARGEVRLQTLKGPTRTAERAQQDDAVAKVVDEIVSAVA